MYDIVINNVKIVDGTGSPWYYGSIAIRNKKIIEIKRKGKFKSGEYVIDGHGLMAAPGFIDVHSHSDAYLLINPKAESKIRQGVTTEVIGNCGSSMAPILKDKLDIFKRRLGELAQYISWDWSTFKEYKEKLEKNGIAINVVPLIGHGTLRINVMGYDRREPKKEELNEMKKLLDQSMKNGAFGLSTGLIYTPGAYAKTEEVIELAKVVAKYGGMYFSHIRSEADQLIEAIKEAIRIGREAGVRVEISHLKSAGIRNWGKINEALKLMEEAREEGIDVTADFYPYTAGSTSLTACIPPWAHEGGIEEMMKRLKDPELRTKIKLDIETKTEGWENLANLCGWDRIVVASCEKNRHYEGLSISEIAKINGKDPYDQAFDLIVEEEGRVQIILHMMREEDMLQAMKSPYTMVGTDGSSIAPYEPLGRGKPHPRNYGTFPRIIGRYARDMKVITIEEAIRKMTSIPANKLNLVNRGLIKRGFWADIVLFNPKTIIDTATFENPHQYPRGIEYIIINGEIVIDKGEHTGKLPGKVLSIT
ncbi:MAG: D-aminoacylase [Candidatus Methanomethylicia archaeon]|nr:D-aminoacylase [Candidatus Methanomethylicia archaeon]